MEDKILKSFTLFMKRTGEDISNLDLIVSVDNYEDDEFECEVMEPTDNGRVWNVLCSKAGTVLDVYEM